MHMVECRRYCAPTQVMLMGTMETTDTGERGEEAIEGSKSIDGTQTVIGAVGQDQIGMETTESNPVSDLALVPGNDRKLTKGLKTCNHVSSLRRSKRRKKWVLCRRRKRQIKEPRRLLHGNKL